MPNDLRCRIAFGLSKVLPCIMRLSVLFWEGGHYCGVNACWGLGQSVKKTHSSFTGHFVYANDTDLQLDSVMVLY
jgi:hypothetical protein